MDGRKLVCGPYREDDEEDEAGEVNGASSTQTCRAANVDHCDIGEPQCEREEDLGVAKIGCADRDLGDKGADEESGGHARQAEEEGLEGDLV